MLVACVWEEEDTWCGQLHETRSGRPVGLRFAASSRGVIIGQMQSRVGFPALEFRDTFGEPAGPLPSGK